MSGTFLPEVLVLGGSGAVGQGMVGALLEAGSAVVAVGRDPSRLRSLRRQFPNEVLDVIPASVADDASAADLAARLASRPRPLAGVIACLGSPLHRGRLLDCPLQDLRARFDRDVLPHLAAARHLLPLLVQADLGGRYLMVGSPCGLRPWAGHGEKSVAAAAIRMLAQVLHEEAAQQGVHLQLLEVANPIPAAAQGRRCSSHWPSALDVGRRAVALLDRRAPTAAIVIDHGGPVPIPSHTLHGQQLRWPWKAGAAA